MVRLLASVLRRGDTAVDVGAHLGKRVHVHADMHADRLCSAYDSRSNQRTCFEAALIIWCLALHFIECRLTPSTLCEPGSFSVPLAKAVGRDGLVVSLEPQQVDEAHVLAHT